MIEDIVRQAPYFMDSFRRTVRDSPDAIMLVDDLNPEGWTRERVDDMSARVYRYLRNHDIGREDFVLVLMPRGITSVVVSIGVWKAGAALVVLEDSYAPERIEFIKRDCGCRLVIDLEAWSEICGEEPLRGHVRADDHDAAFAVYTSGSTGRPKGVVHEYGNIRLTTLAQDAASELSGELERFALIAPLNFVASTKVILRVIEHPMRLYVVSYGTVKNPKRLVEYYRQNRIEMTFLSPSLIRALGGKSLSPSLKIIMTGSEPANGISVEDAVLVNNYTMSEASLTVCVFPIDRPYDQCPIGVPAFPQLNVRLLDDDGNEVTEPGQMGEICFDNPFMRGYLNLPEQTAEALRGGCYHTGDLAVRTPEGAFVIAGRSNDMIKIDGNRIEPAEIEAAFREATGLEWCAAKGFENPDQAFVAVYYTGELAMGADELRAALRRRLPYYMIPAHFVRIEEPPLLPNGKLDRTSLPDPSRDVERAEYVGPRDDLERALCDAFGEVLGVERVGVTEDFYTLGGKSLSAMQVLSLMDLDNLSAVDIFQGRTPERIAQLYREKMEGQEGVTEEEKEMEARRHPHALPAVMQSVIDFQLFTPKAPMWVFPFLFSFGADADPERVLTAGRRLMENHPIFSTIFEFNEDCELQQRYDPSKRARLSLEYMSDEDFEEFRHQPLENFKLLGEPMIRLSVIQTDSNVYMLVVFHHIVMDGSSLQVIFGGLYCAYMGEPMPLDTYYSYLEDEERARSSSSYAQARAYYEANYEGVDWVDNIIPDKHEPGNVNATYTIPSKLTMDSLEAMERRCDISRNGLVTTAALLALARMSKRSEVITTSVFHNRVDARKQAAGGLLSRTLPIGVKLDEYETLADLYAGVSQQATDGIANSVYDWATERENAYVNDILPVVYETAAITDTSWLEKMHAGLEPLDAHNEAALHRTMLQVFETPAAITILLSYMSNIYTEERVAQFADIMTTLLNYLVDVEDTSKVRVADLLGMEVARDEDARLASASKKNEYYDPVFYLSSERYPFVMAYYLTLFDDVDGELLSEVVESLRERFPYFYVRVKAVANELRAVPNRLPVPVKNSWDRTVIGSAENNYHLVALRYEGRRLLLEASHCFTDGSGMMPFLKAILHLYLSRKLGKNFNAAGLRLPGTDFVPGELGNPYPDAEVDAAREPLFQRTEREFYKLGDGPVPMDGKARLFFLRLEAADLMDFCRMNDGSPNAVVSVLMARAIRAVDPSISKDVAVGVAVNHKALLGNYENYHLGSGTVVLDFQRERDLDDLTKSCTIARGQIIAQTFPEDVCHALKQRKATLAQADLAPLQMKLDFAQEFLGTPVASALVSYTGNRSMGDLDPYIDECYVMAEPLGAELLVELNCLNHSFYLAISQSFSSDAYVRAFLRELSAVGIRHEELGAEDFWLPTARFDDIA